MAASSNKVELSAVSSIPQEHVEFNWNVQNFQAVVNTAVEKGEKVIAKLSFNLVNTKILLAQNSLLLIYKYKY